MIADIIRLTKAAMVLSRHGALEALAPPDPPLPARWGFKALKVISGSAKTDKANASNAEKLSDALSELGPSYVKFGQFMATRPDVIGADTAIDLSELQDAMPSFPTTTAKEIVESELGKSADILFEEFSDAVAAASIAQVHKAVIPGDDGSKQVAVKILRPGVDQRFKRDLSSFYFAAKLGEKFVSDLRRLKPVSVVDTLKASVDLELDLRMEAAAYSEMAENTRDDQEFFVPKVMWEYSSKRVLTLEWVDGVKLNDGEELDARGIDKDKIAINLIQSFLRHAIRDGFFHADMHPGNLFVTEDSRIAAVDLGIVGRLGPKERKFLAEILYGFITKNYLRVAEVHFEAGYVPKHHRVEAFAQALRGIGEPLLDRNAEEISMADLLTQLFEVTELFDMETRPELLLLQKTMVVVEGVARELNPAFNMWTASEPVVKIWLEQTIGPEGRLQEAAEGAASLSRFVGQIPDLLTRAETMALQFSDLTAGGVKLNEQTVDSLARSLDGRRKSENIALWIGAVSLAFIALTLAF